MKLPLLLIRKEGKLPRQVLREEYELEYGFSSLEIHKDDVKKHSNILLVDDILATGGTLKAAAMLLEKAGGVVSDIFCFIELLGINGRDALGNIILILLLDILNFFNNRNLSTLLIV